MNELTICKYSRISRLLLSGHLPGHTSFVINAVSFHVTLPDILC